ncbi:MAG: hypothetical protein ACC645_14995 [Pirellulales bacterium]
MPDKFDPYRESLVMETTTIWPDQYDDWEPAERSRIEKLLHENPEQAEQLEYVRTHTGFCRKITVAPADIERMGGVPS